KAVREVEHRIGSLQQVLKVGDQVGRKEIPEASFGEETERVVISIENHGIELRPIGDTDERRDRLTRLTTLMASLQKGVIGALGVAKGLLNALDDPVLGLHRSVSRLALAHMVDERFYCNLSPAPCGTIGSRPS